MSQVLSSNVPMAKRQFSAKVHSKLEPANFPKHEYIGTVQLADQISACMQHAEADQNRAQLLSVECRGQISNFASHILHADETQLRA